MPVKDLTVTRDGDVKVAITWEKANGTAIPDQGCCGQVQDPRGDDATPGPPSAMSLRSRSYWKGWGLGLASFLRPRRVDVWRYERRAGHKVPKITQTQKPASVLRGFSMSKAALPFLHPLLLVRLRVPLPPRLRLLRRHHHC